MFEGLIWEEVWIGLGCDELRRHGNRDEVCVPHRIGTSIHALDPLAFTNAFLMFLFE